MVTHLASTHSTRLNVDETLVDDVLEPSIRQQEPGVMLKGSRSQLFVIARIHVDRADRDVIPQEWYEELSVESGCGPHV